MVSSPRPIEVEAEGNNFREILQAHLIWKRQNCYRLNSNQDIQEKYSQRERDPPEIRLSGYIIFSSPPDQTENEDIQRTR